MISLALLLATATLCFGGATNPTIAPPNTVAVVADEPAPNPVACAAPSLYFVAQNDRANQVAAVHVTFDDPASPSARWTSAMHARHSTCRFKIAGSNDNNSNGVANANNVNCGPVTGNCRRCSFTMPCVCDRLNGAAQADLPLHYKYTWQDNDGVMEESAVQGPVQISVSQMGAPGCPIDWSLGDVRTQYENIPPFNQNGEQ